MQALEVEITDNGIHYILDETQTYIPILTPPENSIGKYGKMRLLYLKEHNKPLYIEMSLNNTLDTHLKGVDEAAYRRLRVMFNKLKKSSGVTERLNPNNPMKWVEIVNSIQKTAEKIILNELIYK